MTTDHPITPTLKLFREWTEYRGADCEDQFWWRVATQAARWGADQELESCCKWFQSNGYHEFLPDKLRTARRPKPPSLKEQALGALENLNGECLLEGFECPEKVATIRRALEALPE